ncbi:unnamed protein product, partial [Rotaria sp. Silwood1]
MRLFDDPPLFSTGSGR